MTRTVGRGGSDWLGDPPYPARRLVALVEPCLPDPEAQARAPIQFYSAIGSGLRDYAWEIRRHGRTGGPDRAG